MALPASGQISMNDVNVELGNPGTTQISLNDTDVRLLFNIPSGAISLSNGYGCSAVSGATDAIAHSYIPINRHINQNYAVPSLNSCGYCFDNNTYYTSAAYTPSMNFSNQSFVNAEKAWLFGSDEIIWPQTWPLPNTGAPPVIPITESSTQSKAIYCFSTGTFDTTSATYNCFPIPDAILPIPAPVRANFNSGPLGHSWNVFSGFTGNSPDTGFKFGPAAPEVSWSYTALGPHGWPFVSRALGLCLCSAVAPTTGPVYPSTNVTTYYPSSGSTVGTKVWCMSYATCTPSWCGIIPGTENPTGYGIQSNVSFVQPGYTLLFNTADSAHITDQGSTSCIFNGTPGITYGHYINYCYSTGTSTVVRNIPGTSPCHWMSVVPCILSPRFPSSTWTRSIQGGCDRRFGAGETTSSESDTSGYAFGMKLTGLITPPDAFDVSFDYTMTKMSFSTCTWSVNASQSLPGVSYCPNSGAGIWTPKIFMNQSKQSNSTYAKFYYACGPVVPATS